MYFDILKFSFKQSLVYPQEVIAIFVRKAIQISALLLFWSILGKSTNGQLNVKELISYFLISAGVVELVMANLNFGRNTLKKIKNGEINNYAVKPVNVIYYLYFSYVGYSGIDYLIAAISISIGLWFKPPQGIISILLFLAFLILAVFISLGINILIAVIGFLTPEASGFKNVVAHINKVLSGAIVPISFFPGITKTIVNLTPFPYLVFGPANAMKTGTMTNSVYFQLGIALFWACFLYFFSLYAWNTLFKRYEAIGI